VGDRNSWDFPNFIAILLDGTIRTELATASNAVDCHLVPFGLISVSSINTFLSSQIVIKVVADQVLVVAIRQVVD